MFGVLLLTDVSLKHLAIRVSQVRDIAFPLNPLSQNNVND